MKNMLKIKKEASLYKDLPQKELENVIRGYKSLVRSNSDKYNFIISFIFMVIPYLIFVDITFITMSLLIIIHYLFMWKYMIKHKKLKLVIDEDKEEIDEIILILEKYLENKKPIK